MAIICMRENLINKILSVFYEMHPIAIVNFSLIFEQNLTIRVLQFNGIFQQQR